MHHRRATSSRGTTCRAPASPSCATTASRRSPRLLDRTGEFERPRHQAVRRHPAHRRGGDRRGHRLPARPRRGPSAEPDPRPLRHPRRRVRLRPRDHHRRAGPLDHELRLAPLDPKEIAAITKVTTRFGELMGIKGLPTTYDGYLSGCWSTTRPSGSRSTPANRRLTEASIRIARERRAAAAAAADAPGDHRADGRAAADRARHAEAAGLVRPRGARRAAAAGAGAAALPAAAHGLPPPAVDLPDGLPARRPRSGRRCWTT